MREIPLTRGKVSIVDDQDYERLNAVKWYAEPSHGTWYARRSTYIDGKTIGVFMHQMVLNVPAGLLPDHINGNGLDNQSANLRSVTHAQNVQNSKPVARSTSRFKGVGWFAQRKKWRVRIGSNGHQTVVGFYDSEVDAALAYNTAALAVHGEFARLNTIGQVNP